MFCRSRFLRRGSDESMSPFDMMIGLVPSMVKCKCCAFLTWWQDWFLPWLDISVDATSSMKKDWLCDDTSSMKKDWLCVDATSNMKKDLFCDDTSSMKKDWLYVDATSSMKKEDRKSVV